MGPDLCPSWRVLTGKTGLNRPPDQVFVSLSAPFFGRKSRFISSCIYDDAVVVFFSGR